MKQTGWKTWVCYLTVLSVAVCPVACEKEDEELAEIAVETMSQMFGLLAVVNNSSHTVTVLSDGASLGTVAPNSGATYEVIEGAHTISWYNDNRTLTGETAVNIVAGERLDTIFEDLAQAIERENRY